ncbi:unnamed protein product [Sympodiomycopsis kandeliae]
MPTATIDHSAPKRNADSTDSLNQPHQPSSKKARRNNLPSSSSSNKKQSTISISIPHPLNVKPAGNVFLSTGPSNRHLTLGSIASLSDELIMHILTSYDLSPPEIATLSQVSRGMRAFANSEGLWRDLFVQDSRINGVMTAWKGSWKQTLGHHLKKQGQVSHLAQYSNPSAQPFYSDVLYLPHRLSLLSVDKFIHSSGSSSAASIAREAATLSTADFHTKYASQNTPVILEKPENGIPGLGMTMDQLKDRYADQWVRAEAIKTQVKTYADYAKGYERQRRTIRETTKGNDIDNIEGAERDHASVPWYDPMAIPDESPYYLFDSELPLRMANEDGLWTIPEQIRQCPDEIYGLGERDRSDNISSSTEADLFSLLAASRPDWRWIIAGPTGSGSGWHKDPNKTSAWNTPLSGSKFWMMLPPDITPPGVFLSEDGADITTPVSIIEWLNDFYDETIKLHGTSPQGSGQLLQGICNAGETVYVPSGWWHLVINLSESIALTQNFVSLSELPQVLHFMKNKYQQISGFKFGPDLSEDPEDCDSSKRKLYQEFIDVLQLYDAKLLQWALEKLKVVEEQEAKTKTEFAESQATIHKSNKRTNGGEATWWEKLKQEEKESDSNNQKSGTFSLGLFGDGDHVDGEELGDVPW